MIRDIPQAHLVVMGVSGSGKSTVGRLVAERLDRSFAEGDDFHSPVSIQKMSDGTPLTDADRVPWLQAIRGWLTRQAATGQAGVVTCSALRRRYRDILREAAGSVIFVHLVGDAALIARRLSDRSGHFMPPDLLRSQYAALEPLTSDEWGMSVSIDQTPERIVDRIEAELTA